MWLQSLILALFGLLPSLQPLFAQTLTFSTPNNGLSGEFGPELFWKISVDMDIRDLPIGELDVGVSGAQSLPFYYSGFSSPISGAPDFVVVSPSKAVAPAKVFIGLNPNVAPAMKPGDYTAQVLFQVPGQSAIYRLQIVLNLNNPGLPDPAVIGGAATWGQENSNNSHPVLSPGEILSIGGDSLGPTPTVSQFNDAGLMATALGSPQATTVTINGIPAPVLWATNNEITAVAPYALAGQSTASIVVTRWGSASPVSIPVTDTRPAIFTMSVPGISTGTMLANGVAGIDSLGITQFVGGTYTGYNSASNPVPQGSIISFYATGAGVWNNQPPDGLVILGPLPVGITPVAPVSLTIGGQTAKLLYAAAAPYRVVGILQVNALVPTGLASGPQPVVLKIGQNDNLAQGVMLYVQ